MRIIKKYAARKMYDVTESRFITLAKIADLIARGEEIQVIDDKTGNDITQTVLAQIILEQQRNKQDSHSMPGLLHEFIKKGTGSVMDFLTMPVFGQLGLTSLTEKKAKEIIGKLIRTKEVPISERDNLLRRLLARTKQSKKTLEVFIKEIIGRMNIPTRKELERLKTEIRELNRRVGTITNR